MIALLYFVAVLQECLLCEISSLSISIKFVLPATVGPFTEQTECLIREWSQDRNCISRGNSFTDFYGSPYKVGRIMEYCSCI